MAVFIYKGRKENGELVEGRLDVDSEYQAVEELTRRGLYIVNLQPLTDESSISSEKTKPKLKELAEFTFRLYELINAGLPLLKALSLLEKQFSKKTMGRIIHEIVTKIRGGESFSQALKNSQAFPPLLSALIASGEAGGNLDFALKQASIIFEKELDLRNKIKSVMFYPSLVLVMGIGTIFFLLSFVIPKIAQIFSDLGQALPLITRLVVSVSNGFAKFWWAFIFLGILGYFGFRKVISSEREKILWQDFKFKVPLINKILFQRELILFSRSLGMLIKSGVPLVRAVELTKAILRSERFKKQMDKLKNSLKEGVSLSEGIRGFLPLEVGDIISVGEESGNLENVLLKIAQNYENNLDYTLKITTQILEPIMILLVGGIVGVIIISVLLPIFQLNMLIR